MKKFFQIFLLVCAVGIIGIPLLLTGLSALLDSRNSWVEDGPLSGARMETGWPQGFPDTITRVVEMGYDSDPFGGYKLTICCFPVADVPRMKTYFQEKFYLGQGEWLSGLPPGGMSSGEPQKIPKSLAIPSNPSPGHYIHFHQTGNNNGLTRVAIDTNRGISYYLQLYN